MSAWVLAAGVFLLGAGLAAALLVFLARLPEALARKHLENRLVEISRTPGEELDDREASLLKIQPEGPIPVVDRLVNRWKRTGMLALWLEQAGVRMSVSGALLLTLAAGVVLAIGCATIFRPVWSPAAGFAAGIAVPIAWLYRRRIARFRKFEEQFPEALELISRAVRAGHAFTSGLKMVADEVGEPVGPEFRKTFDEQNFGLPLKDALANLGNRVPSLDVRFFATAVLIQRESGGNLSELLDNLAYVVRERFKILRQVRVYTAHGRLTGYVLLGLPATLAIALAFINPDHMNLLFRERIGQMMLGAAIVLQVVGYLWIQRVVKIEV